MLLPARPQKDVPSQPVILKDETHAAHPPLLLVPSRVGPAEVRGGAEP